MKNVRLLGILFRSEPIPYCFPVLIIFLAVPLLISSMFRIFDPLEAVIASRNTLQVLLPICIIWWLLPVVKESAEGKGREVLLQYDRYGTDQLCSILLVCVWYLIHLAVSFIFYRGWMEALPAELLRVMVQTMFYAAAFYFLCMMIRHTGIAVMVTVIYYFMTAFFAQDNIFSLITIYSLNEAADDPASVFLTECAAGIAFLLLAAGYGRRRFLLFR